jgi:hypothetical protein
MNKLAGNLVTVVALGLVFAPGPAGAPPQTASVDVTITVLPYAQVSLDQATLNITIAGGQTIYGPMYVGGTVVCNCPVLLFARIQPKSWAPGVWTAEAEVARIDSPGVIFYGHLLRVVVWDIPSDYPGGSFTLQVSGHSVRTISEVPSPASGEVIVTVVPQ